MAAVLDLKLLPFYRINGQEWPALPGLLAVAPPRRAAHGRENDYLIVYVTLSGNMPFATAEYAQIATQMAERFYQTSGSLTAAMRATAEALNRALLDRNLRTTGRGQYITGRLILGVLRGSQFFLVQCGPTHVFWLGGQETRHIHDAQISGRGLGVSQTTPIYYAQVDLRPGDLVMLCAQLPSEWDTALQTEKGGIAVDALRRKLLALTDADLNAISIQAQSGNGQITILEPGRPGVLAPDPSARVSGQASQPARSDARPTPESAGEPAREETLPPLAEILAEMAGQAEAAVPERAAPSPAPPEHRRAAMVQPQRPAKPAAEALEPGLQPRRAIPPQVSPVTAEKQQPPSHRRRDIFHALAVVIQTIRRFSQSVSRSIQTILPRLLPGLQESKEAASLSNTAMFVIAIAVPLVIVVIANVVYAKYGRAAQYQENYDKAVTAAAGAIGQSDPASIRHAWETTLFYLDEAESHQVTQQSQTLRAEAQNALDKMDGIIRLNFRPAIIEGVDRSIQVSRMAASETELYLLNAGRGNILRAFLTNQGYRMDDKADHSPFLCEPGMYGGYQVGLLVDLLALRGVNAFKATVVAMDASGTLLYCAPEKDPRAIPLIPPDIGWQMIAAFTLDTDGKDLYVLDPPARAIWIYTGNQGQFSGPPRLFFSEYIPTVMEDVIDLAVSGDDLYLLHQDGRVTICTLSQMKEVPTRCADPAMYVDSRPEYQSGTTIAGALFTQMSFAGLPDLSLYLFEPNTYAVYRFSPRPDSLIFQQQFQAMVEQRRTLFSAPATAMAISPNRYILLSIGNQVYFATDVP